MCVCVCARTRACCPLQQIRYFPRRSRLKVVHALPPCSTMHDSLGLAAKQEAQQSLSPLITDYVTALSQHLQVQQCHGNTDNNTPMLHKWVDHSAASLATRWDVPLCAKVPNNAKSTQKFICTLTKWVHLTPLAYILTFLYDTYRNVSIKLHFSTRGLHGKNTCTQKAQQCLHTHHHTAGFRPLYTACDRYSAIRSTVAERKTAWGFDQPCLWHWRWESTWRVSLYRCF